MKDKKIEKNTEATEKAKKSVEIVGINFREAGKIYYSGK